MGFFATRAAGVRFGKAPEPLATGWARFAAGAELTVAAAPFAEEPEAESGFAPFSAKRSVRDFGVAFVADGAMQQIASRRRAAGDSAL